MRRKLAISGQKLKFLMRTMAFIYDKTTDIMNPSNIWTAVLLGKSSPQIKLMGTVLWVISDLLRPASFPPGHICPWWKLTLADMKIKYWWLEKNLSFLFLIPTLILLHLTIINLSWWMHSLNQSQVLKFAANKHFYDYIFKGTQEWEFFWLRFWILSYFIVSYA